MLTAVLASTRDLVSGSARPGGPAYYSTTALCLLGFADFRVLTTAGLTYSVIRRLGVEVLPVGPGETVFELTVDGDRTLRLVSRASMDSGLVVRSVTGTDLLVSLTAGELPLSTLNQVVSGRRVVVDVQGFVRRVGANGVVYNDHAGFWALGGLRGREVILRGEVGEFPPECRGANVVRCAVGLGSSVVVTDASGPTYFALSDGYGGSIEPPHGIIGDSIGSGDVFTAVLAYGYLVLNYDFETSLALATAAATLRLRSRLPWYTTTEVEAVARRVLSTLRRIAY